MKKLLLRIKSIFTKKQIQKQELEIEVLTTCEQCIKFAEEMITKAVNNNILPLWFTRSDKYLLLSAYFHSDNLQKIVSVFGHEFSNFLIKEMSSKEMYNTCAELLKEINNFKTSKTIVK